MSVAAPIRIVIAEDHHLVRSAFAEFLAKEEDIEIVGEVGVGGAALLELLQDTRPDILLLDARMDENRVTDTIADVKRLYSDVLVLVVSQYNTREIVEGAISAGAMGYVLKTDNPHSFLQAIRTVARGQKWFSSELTEMLVKPAEEEEEKIHLTPREKQVLNLMAKGAVNDDIAKELVLSRQTVKNYVRNIFNKLGVKNRVEAVLYALDNDLREEDEDDTIV